MSTRQQELIETRRRIVRAIGPDRLPPTIPTRPTLRQRVLRLLLAAIFQPQRRTRR